MRRLGCVCQSDGFVVCVPRASEKTRRGRPRPVVRAYLYLSIYLSRLSTGGCWAGWAQHRMGYTPKDATVYRIRGVKRK